MNHRSFACSLLSSIALAGAAVAQQDDPIAQPITVRVVGHDDGLPRPGVPVYVGPTASRAGVDAQGWLLAESDAVRRLREATFVFTDPDGRATLGSSPHRHLLQVAEPYFRWGNPKVDGREWLVEVGQREPVGVRVVDADGKPLANYPVALHAAGKDMSVAITDATGRAVLGVPADFEARAVVAPAGWVGPKDGFPSIAESLAGRRGVVLTVPPHGSLRIRAVRNGQPVLEAFHAVGFFAPETYAVLSEQVGPFVPSAIGVVYPRVALGLELEAYSPLQRAGTGMLHCRGPREAGACATVDIELGPIVSFRVAGVEAGPQLIQPQVRLVTDEGDVECGASQGNDGTFVIDLRRALAGSKLLRIDLDVAAGRPGHRSGTLAVEHALPAAAIELGEIALQPVGPQLRGVVKDEAGAPVAGESVAISSTGERNKGYVIESGEDGRFTSRQAIVRGADGAPTQPFAYAYSEAMESDVVQGIDGEVVLTLKPRAARRPGIKQNGTVVARLRGLTDVRDLQMRVRLVSKRGEFTPREAKVENGDAVLRFERLREGTFGLRVPGPDGMPVEVLGGIEVSGDGECTDERLAAIDCAAAMRQVVVKVIDADGVPVAGARLEGPGFARQTDGTGTAALWLGRGDGPSVLVSAPGWRGVRIEQWQEQQQVQLERAGTLRVEVVGLPDHVARESLEVWLRDEVRERFAGPRRLLAAGSDTVTLELPARGRYLPMLLATKRNATGSGTYSTTLHAATGPIEITDAPDAPLRIVVSEEELARLEQWLAK